MSKKRFIEHMSRNIRSKEVKTRVAHKCFGCNRLFLAGTKMHVDIIAEDLGIWDCYLCNTCYEIACNLEYNDGFCRGELLEDALNKEN